MGALLVDEPGTGILAMGPRRKSHHFHSVMLNAIQSCVTNLSEKARASLTKEANSSAQPRCLLEIQRIKGPDAVKRPFGQVQKIDIEGRTINL